MATASEARTYKFPRKAPRRSRQADVLTSASLIQEERIESLGQYLMLKFIYRLGPQLKGT